MVSHLNPILYQRPADVTTIQRRVPLGKLRGRSKKPADNDLSVFKNA